MFQSTRARARGISVVEILMMLGVLAVIAAFASTSFGNATNRAELQAAAEGMNFSIQGARSTARELETEVIMHLETNRPDKQNSVSFSFPNRNAELGSSALPQEFLFPENVLLVTAETSIRFDSRGLVATPVQLRLVSKIDERVNQSMLIQ